MDFLDSNDSDHRNESNSLLDASIENETLPIESSNKEKIDLGKDDTERKIENLFKSHENVSNSNDSIVLPY